MKAILILAVALTALASETTKKVPAELQERYLKLLVRSQGAQMSITTAEKQAEKHISDAKAKAEKELQEVSQEFQAVIEEAKKAGCNAKPVEKGIGLECAAAETEKKK